MADEVTKVDGEDTTATNTVDVDALTTKITELQGQVETFKAEQKKIIDQRQKAKQEAIEKEELAGNYKAVVDTLKEEINTYKTKYNDEEIEQLKSIKSEYETFQKAQKEKLLEKFPDNTRDKLAKLPLQDLYDLSETFTGTNIPNVNTSKLNTKNVQGKKMADMSSQELSDLMVSDPDAYRRKLAEHLEDKKAKLISNNR